MSTKNDQEFIEKIAKYWIELGGDAEGVFWLWTDLQEEIDSQERLGGWLWTDLQEEIDSQERLGGF